MRPVPDPSKESLTLNPKTPLDPTMRPVPDPPKASAPAPGATSTMDEVEGRGGGGEVGIGGTRPAIGVLEGAMCVALSSVLCAVGSAIASGAFGMSGLSIPTITLLTVGLATLLPRKLAPLVTAGEGIAAILLFIFFAAVGANG